MALKSWNLASCPYKSLTDGTTDNWTASASGTGEYYYTGGDLDACPTYVEEDGTSISEGTLGSLTASSWAWGDNDSLGADTLYIRLSDDTDPDVNGLDFVQCNELLTLLTATSGWSAFCFPC